MSEVKRLPYDVFNSTYGWRIKVRKEFDYRVQPDGDLIVEGYSKLMQCSEAKNKAQLLLSCMSMLFDKRWIYKCDGIIIYKASNGLMFKPMRWDDAILVVSKDGEQIRIIARGGYDDEYCLDMISKMMLNYNRGYQRGVGLRIA